MTSSPKLFPVLFGITLFCFQPVTADEPNAEVPIDPVEDTLVVTASRREESLATVGTALSVLSREDIEARGDSSVLELLRGLPFLEVAQTGGPGHQASLFLRGGSSSHTLVLIDGIRVNNPSTGAYDFADLRGEEIDRIEVLRGSQSSLWGSEAIGGVVQVITRRGDQESFRALAEVGDIDYGRLGLSAGGQGRWNWRASLSGEKFEEFSTASENNGNSEVDGHEVFQFSGHGGVDLSDQSTLSTNLRLASSETDLDGFSFVDFRPADDPDYRQDRRTTTLGIRLNNLRNSTVQWGASVGLVEEDLEGIDPSEDFNNFRIDTRATSGSLRGQWQASDSQVLSVGVDYENREVENLGQFSESDRLGALWLQEQWYGLEGSLSLSGAIRYDDHSRFGGETTWRGAVAFIPNLFTKIHASLGTGFKAPTLNDLYFPFFSNPDLLPETSLGWDVGIGQDFNEGKVQYDLTYFSLEVDDLIGFDASFSIANIDEASIQGIEGTLAYRPHTNLSFDFGYAWTDTENKTTGLPLARRPENRFTLASTFRIGDLVDVYLSLLSVRDRVESSGQAMDDYERVDFRLGWPMNDHLTWSLRGENVLDDDYEEIPGYTTPGRYFALGLQWTM